MRGANLPFDASVSVAAWNEDAVCASELCCKCSSVYVVESLGIDPTNLDVDTMGPTGMTKRFGNGKICIGECGVFANDCNLDRRLCASNFADELLPLGEIGSRGRQAQVANEDIAKPEALELERHFVDRPCSRCRNHRLDRNVGEERNLLANIVGHWTVGTQDDYVGLDTATAQLLDRMLRRLRLELACCGEFGEERDVDIERVVATNVFLQLTNRLNERE